MTTKKNELHIDDILGSNEPKNKDAKTAKQSTNDWADEEEEGYAFSIAKEQAAAKKTQKKKNTGKGWGDVEAAPPKTSDFEKIQDDQKKKIINKPGQARQTTGVSFGSEAFPGLGEAPTKSAPKKNPEPTPMPVQQAQDDGFTPVGPKRFMNTKKKETGEHFAPLDPNVVEKQIPVAPVREKPTATATTTTATTTTTTAPTSEPAQTRAPGIFQRKAADEPAEVPVDSKFKFGGEGPRKFVTGSKISFKREEQKDEHEALRLQREREIEEKLQREKEELSKQRENREAKKPFGDDEKKPARFLNAKKEADKQAPPQPEKVEEPEHVESKHPKESVEMHGSLSNKGWGDGPLIKKSQKK